MNKQGYGWGDTHGHQGWRCKKPKNLDWWRHLDKDMTGHDGMVSSEIDPMYLIKKEYKTVADVYCDEWEVPAWYKFSEELRKKALEEEAKNNATAAAAKNKKDDKKDAKAEDKKESKAQVNDSNNDGDEMYVMGTPYHISDLQDNLAVQI